MTLWPSSRGRGLFHHRVLVGTTGRPGWNPLRCRGRRGRPQGPQRERRTGEESSPVRQRPIMPHVLALGHGRAPGGSVVRSLRDGSRSYDDLCDHSPRPWRRPPSFRAQQYPRSRSRHHRRTARHTPARPRRPTSARGGRIPSGCHGKHPPGPRNRDCGRRGPAGQGGLLRARRNGFARTGMRNGMFWPHPLPGSSTPHRMVSSTLHPRSDHLLVPAHQIGDGPAVPRGFHPVGSTPARVTMFRSTPGGLYRRPTP